MTTAWWGPVRKAVAAGLVAGVGAVGAVMLDGGLHATELVYAAGAALVAAAATWTVPNTPTISPGTAVSGKGGRRAR